MKKILTILILLFSLTLMATTYYVRTDGNDGNVGTSDTAGGAWLTPGYAWSQVSDGDDIYVNAGTYVIDSSDQPGGILTYGLYMNPAKTVDWIATGVVVFQPAAGETLALIYLRGSTKATTFTGFTFEGGNIPTNTIHIYNDAGGKTFTNCIISNGTDKNIVFSVSDNTFTGCTITGNCTTAFSISSSNTVINNCIIDVVPSLYVFNIYGTITGTCEITNNTITSASATYIFYVQATGACKFSGNTISGQTSITRYINTITGTGSIEMDDETYISTIVSTDDAFYIRNGSYSLNIHDCSFSFTNPAFNHNMFGVQDQLSATFDSNIFTTEAENFYSHISITSSGSSSGTQTVTNNTFYSKGLYNYIVKIGSDSSDGGDNDFDGEAIITGNLVYGAVYYDNSKDTNIHGLMIGHNIDGTIANNYVNGTGHGIVVKTSGDVYTTNGVFNNVLVNNVYTGIIAKGVQSVPIYNNTVIYTIENPSIGIDVRKNEGSGNSDNCMVKNNIIYSTTPVGDFVAINLGNEEFANGYSFNYNDIYSTTEANNFRAKADGTEYTTLATWQTKLGDDTNGAANSISSDPLFDGNYSPGLPCIQTAENLGYMYSRQSAKYAKFPDPEITWQEMLWDMGAIGTKVPLNITPSGADLNMDGANRVTYSDFSSGTTGWTSLYVSFSDNTAIFDTGLGSNGFLEQTLSGCTSGNRYRIVCKIKTNTMNTGSLLIYTKTGSLTTGSVVIAAAGDTGAQTADFTYNGTGSILYIRFLSASSGICVIDNISVVDITNTINIK